MLASFLALYHEQYPANNLAVTAPEANAYDFSSGGIVPERGG